MKRSVTLGSLTSAFPDSVWNVELCFDKSVHTAKCPESHTERPYKLNVCILSSHFCCLGVQSPIEAAAQGYHRVGILYFSI